MFISLKTLPITIFCHWKQLVLPKFMNAAKMLTAPTPLMNAFTFSGHQSLACYNQYTAILRVVYLRFFIWNSAIELPHQLAPVRLRTRGHVHWHSAPKRCHDLLYTTLYCLLMRACVCFYFSPYVLFMQRF